MQALYIGSGAAAWPNYAVSFLLVLCTFAFVNLSSALSRHIFDQTRNDLHKTAIHLAHTNIPIESDE